MLDGAPFSFGAGSSTVSRMLTRLLIFITGTVSLATVLAYGGRWLWPCEMLVALVEPFPRSARDVGLHRLCARTGLGARVAGAVPGVAANPHRPVPCEQPGGSGRSEHRRQRGLGPPGHYQ